MYMYVHPTSLLSVLYTFTSVHSLNVYRVSHVRSIGLSPTFIELIKKCFTKLSFSHIQTEICRNIVVKKFKKY